MSTQPTRWTSWLIASLGGAMVLGAVALLFRGPASMRDFTAAPGTPRAREAIPPVGLVSGAEGAADTLLKEEALLRDPTPLFLPTAWNAAENALPTDLQREPGSHFEGYPARLMFAESELRLSFPALVSLPARPAEGFSADKPVRPFGGFGETDGQVTALESRHGFVEVVAAVDGRVMLTESLREARPPGEGNWEPLEFLVAVDATGMLRPPVLTESSRVAAVDSYFQEYLGKGLHIGERLPAGFYRICVGP